MIAIIFKFFNGNDISLIDSEGTFSYQNKIGDRCNMKMSISRLPIGKRDRTEDQMDITRSSWIN